MALTVITNKVPRHILYWFELTDTEREEFDYIDNPEEDCPSFVRYKGQVYDLSQFMSCIINGYDQGVWDQWDGYYSDSAFSGVLVRYTDDCDSVVLGTYYSSADGSN